MELMVIGPPGAGPNRPSSAQPSDPPSHQMPILLKVTMMSFKTAVARGCSTSK